MKASGAGELDVCMGAIARKMDVYKGFWRGRLRCAIDLDVLAEG